MEAFADLWMNVRDRLAGMPTGFYVAGVVFELALGAAVIPFLWRKLR